MVETDRAVSHPPNALIIRQQISIPLKEFEFSYAHSSGPGGQNVNKVNSKVLLRWSVRANSSLPAAVRERFVSRFGNRLTAEGDLLISSQRFRDQPRNVEDCLEKLRGMVAEVVAPPKRRKRTRPTRASVRRRLDNKRHTSEKKQNRRGDE